MLRQAENDVLTMRFADTGPINLEAKAYNGGTLVLDGAGQIDLSDNVDNVVQLADDAQLQIRGGAGDDTIQAGDGGTLLDGGTGEDVLIAGTGAGSDQVQFEIGYGSDTVENFNVAEDIITLDGFELSDWDGLLALAVETDGNTIFDFGNGDVLTLQGVALADVVPTNFISEGEPLHQGPPTIQIAVGTSAAQLNAMITEAADGTVFEFAAGNHVFDQSIIIARDNVTLMGTDSETVTVTFAFAEGSGWRRIRNCRRRRYVCQHTSGRGRSRVQSAAIARRAWFRGRRCYLHSTTQYGGVSGRERLDKCFDRRGRIQAVS